MSSFVVRTRALLSVALVLIAVACAGESDAVGASKLDAVEEGMPKDSVLPIIGTGPLTPIKAPDVLRLVNGYRTQIYLVNGVNYQVIYYREALGSLEDSISRAVETPILLKNDTVMGWGWNYYEEKSAELGIPNPLNSAARLDSIAKSQQPGAPKP
jgi:hypothetical protein